MGFCAFWTESSATITCNDELIACFRESEFSEKQHDYSFPLQAIKACLANNQLSLDQIDHIVFYEKPVNKFEKIMKDIFLAAPFSFLLFLHTTREWISEGRLFFKSKIENEFSKIENWKKGTIILFGNSAWSNEVLSQANIGHDYRAALQVWCLYLNNPLPESFYKFHSITTGPKSYQVEKKLFWNGWPKTPTDELSTSELRKFGMVLGAIVILVFGIFLPAWRGIENNRMYLMLGLALLVYASFFPGYLKKPYILWMFFARIVGKLKALVFYTVLYYLVISPYALLIRMFFKKLLQTVEQGKKEADKFDMKSPF